MRDRDSRLPISPSRFPISPSRLPISPSRLPIFPFPPPPLSFPPPSPSRLPISPSCLPISFSCLGHSSPYHPYPTLPSPLLPPHCSPFRPIHTPSPRFLPIPHPSPPLPPVSWPYIQRQSALSSVVPPCRYLFSHHSHPFPHFLRCLSLPDPPARAAPRSPQLQSPSLAPLEPQQARRSRWSFTVVNVFLYDARARRRPSCTELQCCRVQVVPWRGGEGRAAMEKGERDRRAEGGDGGERGLGSSGWVAGEGREDEEVEGETREDEELAGAMAALGLPVQFSGGARTVQSAQEVKVSSGMSSGGRRKAGGSRGGWQVVPWVGFPWLASAVHLKPFLMPIIRIKAQTLKCLYSCVPMMQQQGGGSGGDGGGGGGGGGSGGARGGKKKRRGRRRGDGQATAECAPDAGVERGAEGVAGVGPAIAVEGGADAARQAAADGRDLTGSAAESAAGMAVVGSGPEAVVGGMGTAARVAAEAEVMAVSANVAARGAAQMGGEQMGGEQMGGEQMGGEQMGGEQMGGEQMGGEQMGGEQMGGEQMGGEQMGGEQMGGEQMGGEQMGEEQMGEEQMGEDQMGEDQMWGEQVQGLATGEQAEEGRAEGDSFVVAEEGAWQAVWEPLSHGVYFCNAAATITQWHPPDHGEGSGLACWVGWTPQQAVAGQAVSAEGDPAQAETEQVLLEPAVAEQAVAAGYEKYWQQRYGLFSRFNEGVLLDADAWPLVTPEAIAAHHSAMCAAVMYYDDATCAGVDAATSAGGGGAAASAGDSSATCADDGAATLAAAMCVSATRAALLSSEEDALEQRGVRVTAGEEEGKEGGEGEVNRERDAMGRQEGEEEPRDGSLGEGRCGSGSEARMESCEHAAGTRGAADVGGVEGVEGGAGVVVDAFCGVGGNTIHLAKLCPHVLAVDMSVPRLAMLHHNLSIYGPHLPRRVDALCADFLSIALRLKADVVFLSPPWGGPEYLDQSEYDIWTMLQPVSASALLQLALSIAPSVAMYLPRNTPIHHLEQLARSITPSGPCLVRHS
ncbi:unnamed protein product [Closterium sp. NIES-65]|nr:unnamed protein product [Closterium sp. NIES-65]